MSHESSPEAIFQLGSAYWASRTLLSAVELGLFTELAKAPMNLATLQTKLGLHPRAARDFLDALVSLKMLEREGGVYRNTPETAQFLDKNKPSYIGGILEMSSRRLYADWGKLTQAIRDGKAQNEGDTFERLYSDPKGLREFLSAMTAASMGAAMAIAKKFPWKNYRTFVDVGAAQGCVPVQVAAAHPHLSGGSFDLAPCKPVFEEYVKSFHLESRLKFQAGDFFKEPLPKADVLIMGHILHDWGLKDKMMLLRKAHEALPAGGSLIVYEALIDDDRRKNTFGLLMSLNMLIETPEGFDYTGADGMGWMKEVGFRETRVETLDGPSAMIVGVK